MPDSPNGILDVDEFMGSECADVHLGYGLAHETVYVDADCSEHRKILANGLGYTLAKAFFNRVEVRAVGREIEKGGSILDDFVHAQSLVTARWSAGACHVGSGDGFGPCLSIPMSR